MTAQKISQIREVLFAVVTSLVSFQIMPESFGADTVAVVLALAILVWGMVTKATRWEMFHSFLRKGLQSLAAILVMLGWLDSPQAAALIQVVTLTAAMNWSWEDQDEAVPLTSSSTSRLPMILLPFLCAFLSLGIVGCGAGGPRISGYYQHEKTGAQAGFGPGRVPFLRYPTDNGFIEIQGTK